MERVLNCRPAKDNANRAAVQNKPLFHHAACNFFAGTGWHGDKGAGVTVFGHMTGTRVGVCLAIVFAGLGNPVAFFIFSGGSWGDEAYGDCCGNGGCNKETEILALGHKHWVTPLNVFNKKHYALFLFQ
jgi:hypothetical protein